MFAPCVCDAHAPPVTKPPSEAGISLTMFTMLNHPFEDRITTPAAHHSLLLIFTCHMSHASALTSHPLPITCHLSPVTLTCQLLPFDPRLSPLTFHPSPLTLPPRNPPNLPLPLADARRYQGQVGAHLVLGGVDSTGAHLFTVHAHGSTDKLPYVTMGSGSLAAMAVFESSFREGMTVSLVFFGVFWVERVIWVRGIG